MCHIHTGVHVVSLLHHSCALTHTVDDVISAGFRLDPWEEVHGYLVHGYVVHDNVVPAHEERRLEVAKCKPAKDRLCTLMYRM